MNSKTIEEEELENRLNKVKETRLYNAGKEKNADQIEKDRKRIIKGFFRYILQREMTMAEYVDYTTKFDGFSPRPSNPSATYNIKDWLKERGLYNDKQIQEGSGL